MRINITPIKQLEPNECAVTCLRMILGYYEDHHSATEIYDYLPQVYDRSSYNTDIARLAHQKGYSVDCFAYHLYITDPADAQLSATKLIDKLRSQSQHPWFDPDYNLLVESTIQAIKEGVSYHIQKPSLSTLYSYLEQGIPLIASVNHAALHYTQGIVSLGHNVVLTGFDQDHFWYIDPELGREETVSGDDLYFAIASLRAITSSSYLIVITKQAPPRFGGAWKIT